MCDHSFPPYAQQTTSPLVFCSWKLEYEGDSFPWPWSYGLASWVPLGEVLQLPLSQSVQGKNQNWENHWSQGSLASKLIFIRSTGCAGRCAHTFPRASAEAESYAPKWKLKVLSWLWLPTLRTAIALVVHTPPHTSHVVFGLLCVSVS